MSMRMQVSCPLLAFAVCVGCDTGRHADRVSDWSIDQRSYSLGGIGAFAEMVGAGVKQLALSAPLEPAEMDAVVEEARRIAADHGVEIHRDTAFLVTDLFPARLTEGKHVLLICLEPAYQDYLDLKARKRLLIDSGRYDADARVAIATRMGELLSYSDEKIADLLAADEPH